MNPHYEIFTGGPLDTNAILVHAPCGKILFDAPQGADAAFAKLKLDMLILTHGHFDHVSDAAAIARRHRCPVLMHPLTVPMVTDREFFRKWGFALEIEPVKPTELVEEGSRDLLGLPATLFHVPGHCPGSLCTLFPTGKFMVGGDVLFAGGVGRWDLPGGDYDTLLSGIREKLLPLDDNIVVLPGHGPPTSLGRERRSNPFLVT